MPKNAAVRAVGSVGHARVAVLTIIDEEFDAVRQVFGATHEVGTTGVYSPVDAGEGGQPSYPFVLAQATQRSNTPAGERPAELARMFRPEVFMVVGIAGGVLRMSDKGDGPRWRGSRPGDVVVAEYVHYGEYAKHLSEGSFRRHFQIDHPASHLVTMHGLAPARDAREPRWHAVIRAERPESGVPEVAVGEILAVEGIAGAPDRAAQGQLLRSYDNAIAVDMESMGVGRALHRLRSSVHYNPTWMCVRGISDPVHVPAVDAAGGAVAVSADADNDEARRMWKPYAAEAAAVYARHIVARLLASPRPAVPRDLGAPAWAFPSGPASPVGG